MRTLEEMRNLARRDAATDEIRSLAIYVHDPLGLNAWLRQVWRIVPDPVEAEFVRSPAWVVRSRQFEGDCDDSATLATSVLIALGIPSLIVAVRMATETEFSHVFVRVPSYGNLDIDPIVPVEHMPIRFGEAMVLEA